MTRFDRQIETALRLIKKNGQAVKWRVIDDPAPVDPNKPWEPGAATPVDEDVRICFLPMDAKTFVFMKATEVPKGSVVGLMGNVPFEPNIKDVVIRDANELRIESIDLLAPNGQKILYTVVFKQ